MNELNCINPRIHTISFNVGYGDARVLQSIEIINLFRACRETLNIT
jgi:hypothetical protein